MFCLLFSKKGSECLKYVFLLKGLFTFKFRILYFYMLCLFTLLFCFASINSILSKFGGALRYLFFSVIKCYAIRRRRRRGGRANATWEPGNHGYYSLFDVFLASAVCVCDLFFTLVICQHKKARFLIRFFFIYFCVVLIVFFFRFAACYDRVFPCRVVWLIRFLS